MCGFFGLYQRQKKKFDLEKFHNSAEKIKNRGPDGESFLSIEKLYLKFFRLSIIDKSNAGMQPMVSKNKRYYMVFNGEIYNANKIKKKFLLENKFFGRSDSEVLFYFLIKKKTEALEYLEGMFSFVFYDKELDEIILARDRFGIKPLYYYFNDYQFIFSSEIKPILNFFNKNQLNIKNTLDFFLKGSMDHYDKTFFSKVYSVKPGCYIKIFKNKIKEIKYWDISHTKQEIPTKKNNLFELKRLIKSSVKKHLISDQKIGLFLSGGTDSNSLAYLISKEIDYKLKTFTYGFTDDNRFSEFQSVKKNIKNLNIESHNFLITPGFVQKNIEQVVEILESPFTSIRILGMYNLYNEAHKKGLKVIIEGDGGDEIFGGYDYNFIFYLKDCLKKNTLFTNISKLIEFVKLKNKKKKSYKFMLLKNLLITSTFQNGSTSDGSPYVNIDFFNKDLLNYHIDENYYENPKYSNINNLQSAQFKDMFEIKLPRSLKYKDRLSMHFGIENRVPFLDHKLAEFAFNLPNEDKIKNNDTRYLFKKALNEMSDHQMKFTKSKKTIVDPQQIWMKKNLRDFILDNFKSKVFRSIDLFNHKKVISYYEIFFKDKESETNSFQLFQVLTFIFFYKKFFND